ncbi:MAG: hypothetical protein NVS2B17_01060 [Candidatus Velthaea sp.]
MMLQARNLSVRYGAVAALDGVDLDIPERGTFLIIGPNGAGKTTLINVLTRITRPAGGTLVMDDRDLLASPAHDLAALGIGRSFQHAELFARASAIDNVLAGMHHRLHGSGWALVGNPRARRAERAARERAYGILEHLGLAEVCDVAAGALSHGYQKLVDIARALAADPRLLLLDEPFAGLTEGEIPKLVDVIRSASALRAVLIVEHHLELVLPLAERVTVLDHGEKIAEGPPEIVVRDPAVIASYLGSPAAC